MTSEQLKDSLVREVLQACTPWTDGEQRERLEASLRMALHSVTLQKEETSLSVSVEDPNEEYLKQFLAIKMVKGLSPKSLKLYANTIRRMFLYTGKSAAEITANAIR